MKLSASTPEEQRRQRLLLGVLAIVAVGVWYLRPTSPEAERPSPASNSAVPGAVTASAPRPATGTSGRPTPEAVLPQPVRLADLEPVPVEPPGTRNPFGFGVPPAPPRPPTPAPAPAPPPRVEPPPPSGPPPLPPIPVKFLGFVEDPARPGKVVSLSVGGNVVMAREGDLVAGRYRLVKIGLESIEMAYPDGRGRQTIRMSGE